MTKLSLAIVLEQPTESGKVRKYPLIEHDENSLIRMIRSEYNARLKHIGRLKRTDERLDALLVGTISRTIEDIKKETKRLV